MSRPSWDNYFLGMAYAASARADCTRRKVGCVITLDNRVIGTGYNGAPAGDEGCLTGACPRGRLGYATLAEHGDYDSGPGRCIALHAEANALLYARTSCQGATAYITDPPCPSCEKLLRGAGVTRVVHP